MKANPLHLLRTFFAATGLAASTMTGATTSTAYSDLWAAPNEPGWGLNISQQADTLFGTLFIYGSGEQAVWYSVTLTNTSTGPNGAGTYSGTLYQTSGPANGTPYNPALVKYRQVGLLTIAFGDDAHGLLTYSIDSVGSTKQITRLTFTTQNVVGSYIGSTQDVTFGCTNPTRNGLVTTDPGPFTITQTGNTMVIKAPTCTYTGTWEQEGQIGRAVSKYTCTNGAFGDVTFSALQATNGGMTGNYNGDDTFCKFSGNIGGMRVLP
jgi:hypothetical protein